MSDPLYQTPQEALRESERRTKGEGGGGKNYFTDRVNEGLQYNPNTGKYDRTGWAYWGGVLGMTNDENIRALEEGQTAVREAREIDSAVQKSGLTDAEISEQLAPGQRLTAQNVGGIVSKAARDYVPPTQQAQIDRAQRQDREATQARQASNRITQEQNANANRIAMAQLQQTANSSKDQMTLALMEMQDRTNTRKDDLLFRKEEARREDMRYNERIEELDRKDRRQNMQNLAMGLASLGAAFAL